MHNTDGQEIPSYALRQINHILTFEDDCSKSSLSTMPSSLRLHDVLIIGGGPAGLSVALGLARQHKSCVVFSDSKFRNEGAAAMHSVASRDGERPAEFRRITREQIVKYGNTTFVDITVISVCKEHVDGYDGYKATDVNGEEWTGKKLVLATGSQDIGPNIEGYAENWPHNMCVTPSARGLTAVLITKLNQIPMSLLRWPRAISPTQRHSHISEFIIPETCTNGGFNFRKELNGDHFHPRSTRRVGRCPASLEKGNSFGHKYRKSTDPTTPILARRLECSVRG